mmetsp:Transcript_32429/g.84185  ORF Transcript_32429/g.84185 Transcript_32429/m.84185 type:complete len:252 (+) Transcript_32429:195-950(+)
MSRGRLDPRGAATPLPSGFHGRGHLSSNIVDHKYPRGHAHTSDPYRLASLSYSMFTANTIGVDSKQLPVRFIHCTKRVTGGSESRLKLRSKRCNPGMAMKSTSRKRFPRNDASLILVAEPRSKSCTALPSATTLCNSLAPERSNPVKWLRGTIRDANVVGSAGRLVNSLSPACRSVRNLGSSGKLVRLLLLTTRRTNPGARSVMVVSPQLDKSNTSRFGISARLTPGLGIPARCMDRRTGKDAGGSLGTLE